MSVADYEMPPGPPLQADASHQFAFTLAMDGARALTAPDAYFVRATAQLGLPQSAWGFTLVCPEGIIPMPQEVTGYIDSEAFFYPGELTYAVLQALTTGSRRITGALIGGEDQPSYVRLSGLLVQALWYDDFDFVYRPGSTMEDIEDLTITGSSVQVISA